MKKLSTILIVLIGSYLNTNAAIQYTDVTPDDLFTSTGNFMINATEGMKINFGSPHPNFRTDQIMGSTMRYAAVGGFDMKIYNFNDNIESVAGSFFTQYIDLSTYQNNYYVGFEITIIGQKHYGWMKLSSSANSVTVHEYAYEDVANTPIKAGDKGITNINDLTQTIDFNVFPNPNTGNFTVNINNNNNSALTITNVLGKTVLSKTIISKKENISLANYDKGIYFITITSNNNNKTTKLLIQ